MTVNYPSEVPRMKGSIRTSNEKIKGVENSYFPEIRVPLKNLQHVPCKFYRQGVCTAGKNCPFSHNLSLESEETPCKYFQKGNCKFGAKCALAHVYFDGKRKDTQIPTFFYGIPNDSEKVAFTFHNGYLQETSLHTTPLIPREYNFSMEDNVLMQNESLKDDHTSLSHSSTFNSHSELKPLLKPVKDMFLHETQLSPNFDYNRVYSSRNETFVNSIPTKPDFPEISSFSFSGTGSVHSPLQHKNVPFSPLLSFSGNTFSDEPIVFKSEKNLKLEDESVQLTSEKCTNSNHIHSVSSNFLKDTWLNPWGNPNILRNNDKNLSKLAIDEKLSLPVSQKSFTFNDFQKMDDHESFSNINFRSNPSSFGTSPSSRFSAFFSKHIESSDNLTSKRSGIISYHDSNLPYHHEYNYNQINGRQIPSILFDTAKNNTISYSKDIFSPLEQKLSGETNKNGSEINKNLIKQHVITVDDETQFRMDEEIPENIVS
ncbi:hypothetical protein PCANB_002839 [Pneumocystis canis]|nr:hypothetical protein PCANB_002839 [Pneumocystis canis]